MNDVVDVLACPHCCLGLTRAEGALRCPRDHTFDIARQGYVSLLSGRGRLAGDNAEMVAARAEFLAEGQFAPIATRIVESSLAACESRDRGSAASRNDSADAVLDVGAGTGYYLASVLDRMPDSVGVALDVSKYACRRAAKSHPRVGAVLADVWQRLPVRDGAIALALDVFAPRNVRETHRVLASDGHLVLVTPNAGHLGELIPEWGLLRVDEEKQQRIDTQLAGWFAPVQRTEVEFPMALRPHQVSTLIEMGPSAWHVDTGALPARIANLPESFEVTASVTVSVHRKLAASEHAGG